MELYIIFETILIAGLIHYIMELRDENKRLREQINILDIKD